MSSLDSSKFTIFSAHAFWLSSVFNETNTTNCWSTGLFVSENQMENMKKCTKNSSDGEGSNSELFCQSQPIQCRKIMQKSTARISSQCQEQLHKNSGSFTEKTVRLEPRFFQSTDQTHFHGSFRLCERAIDKEEVRTRNLSHMSRTLCHSATPHPNSLEGRYPIWLHITQELSSGVLRCAQRNWGEQCFQHIGWLWQMTFFETSFHAFFFKEKPFSHIFSVNARAVIWSAPLCTSVTAFWKSPAIYSL